MSGHVLIVDPIVTNRIVFKVKLASAYYGTSQASTIAEAKEAAREARPDVVLCSPELPDGTIADLRQAIEEVAPNHSFSVIAILPEAKPGQRAEVLRQGADNLLSKPVREDELFARLRSVLRRHTTLEDLGAGNAAGMAESAVTFARPKRVALVTLRQDSGTLWKAALSGMTHHKLRLMSHDDLLGSDDQALWPEAYIIEVARIGGPGLRLITDLRTRGETRNAPILVVSAHGNREVVPTALDVGAGDACDNGFDAEEVSVRLDALIQAADKEIALRARLKARLEEAVIDPLTGLHNRRHAMRELMPMVRHARDNSSSLALLALDLDHFKAINDQYGHAAGDEVLQEFAQRMKSEIRPVDLSARMGGEEFIVALPGQSLFKARLIGERICRAIADTPFKVSTRAQPLNVSVSVGVASLSSDAIDQAPAQALINRLLGDADAALYGAKARGRNCVLHVRPAA